MSNLRFLITTFHNDESFTPSAWQIFGVGAFGSIVPKVNEYEKEYVDTFRFLQNQIISKLLKEVSGDQIKDMPSCHDYVDISLRQKEKGFNNNVCCHNVYSSGNRSCPNCNCDPKYNPIG